MNLKINILKEVTIQNKIFTFLVLIILLSCSQTQAYTITKTTLQQSDDFVVEPGKTEIFLNPGETITKTISVTNRTNRPLDFNVGIENFIGSNSPETAVVLLPPGSDTPYPLNEYVNPEINEFTLQFGEKITFNITISVPENIEPGGHYGAIIISNRSSGRFDSEGNEVKGGTQLTSRIGSLILMRINGSVEESANLDGFKISGPKKLFYQKMPNSFEVVFNNTGTVHLVPYGNIVIKNLFGSTIAQIPVDAYFAMPDSKRYQTITWGGKKFSFGYYKAELELYKGFGNQFESAKVGFFVIPLMVIIPAFIIIAIAFLVLYILSKKFEIKRK